MLDAWVAYARRFASKEEMGKKMVLFPYEELGYEKIVTELEKVWEGLLRGKDNRCKERDWIGFGREQGMGVYGLLCFIYL
jgi:hypothetical protein